MRVDRSLLVEINFGEEGEEEEEEDVMVKIVVLEEDLLV